jgi:hypothetical protein
MQGGWLYIARIAIISLIHREVAEDMHLDGTPA